MRSKRKGKSGEREIVTLASAAGLIAERTWTTAMSADATLRRCDVTIEGHKFQVKRVAGGFKSLYNAIRDVEGVLIRQDGEEWLAVIPIEQLFRLYDPNN